MEGFWTKIAMPIATLVLSFALPALLFKVVFFPMMVFYGGYLILRRHVDIATFQLLSSGEGMNEETVTKVFTSNANIGAWARVCRWSTWLAMLAGFAMVALL